MPKSKYSAGKDGRFRTSISTGQYDNEGRPILIRVSSSKSSADLERKVREIKYEIEHGTRVSPTKGTFKEYAQEWLYKYKANRSIRTQEMYQTIIDKHLGDLGNYPISEITSSHVQLLINELSDRYRVAQQTLCMLNQVFKIALLNKIILSNPCALVQAPKTPKKRAEKRIIESEEKALLKNVDCDLMRKAFLLTLYGTGMRPSEAIALTWNDVDFNKGTISITKAVKYSRQVPISVGMPKTDTSLRVIPMVDFVSNVLLQYKNSLSKPKGYIFTDNGKIKRYDSYLNMFYSALASALGYSSALKAKQLSGITPYTMRHNFCTECRAAGISIESCQMLMGHASAQMVLEIYSHYSQREEIEIKVKKLGL